jgi:aromatic-L-amino-acid decarboxylase
MSDIGDLPPDQARLWLHRVAGWAAEYREKIDPRRITPEPPGDEPTAVVPPAPPEHGEKLPAIFEDFERVIVPGLVHSAHPSFLGGSATASAPGILGHWLATVVAPSVPSAVAAELEQAVLAWMRETLGLAEGYEGLVYDTPSLATLHVLAAARQTIDSEVRRRGVTGAPKLLVYTSAEADGAIERAAVMLGLGEDSVRRVETDGEFRLRPAALRAAIARDVHARLRPFAVVAMVGTAASVAVDPVPAIADVCAEQRLWLHVDAGRAGMQAALPEGRWVMDGVNRADSVFVSALGANVLYTRRAQAVREVRGEPDGGERLRTLPAWMTFRAFGRAGIESRLREQLRLARQLAQWVEADPDFELVVPTTTNVVCFRARPAGMPDDEADALNTRLVAQLMSGGRVYVELIRLDGRATLRATIGNALTTERHLAEAWTLLHDAFDRLLID